MGVPNAGVTSAGEVANTNFPVPVSSLITPANSADVVDDNAEILSVVYTPFVTESALPVNAPTNSDVVNVLLLGL